MTRSIRRIALAAICATTALGLAATPALATHFQSESYQELLAQLHKREIVAIVLHPSGPKAHASARNGGHFTVTYTPAEVEPLRAAATAGGSSFAIATAKPKSTTTHHKLRYIAGGVLIVVIVIVLVVLLIGRRRTLEEEGPSGEAASAPPPAGPG
jgi:nitrate reductase gamma subunit